MTEWYLTHVYVPTGRSVGISNAHDCGSNTSHNVDAEFIDSFSAMARITFRMLLPEGTTITIKYHLILPYTTPIIFVFYVSKFSKWFQKICPFQSGPFRVVMKALFQLPNYDDISALSTY